MRKRRWLLAGMALLVQVAGAQGTKMVTGTATYRERIALPPNAVFEATLEDVFRADAPADVTGRAREEKPGQPPFQFSTEYDPARIVECRSCSVRARVTAGGTLMFITDRSYPVLTRGNGSQVAMMIMRRASASSGGGPANRLGALPASFSGELPCADCPGIRYALNLFPDKSFFLGTTYSGRGEGKPVDDIGRWNLSKRRVHAKGRP